MMRKLFPLFLALTSCASAPTFKSVAAKVPEIVQCPEPDALRAKDLVKRWLSDRDLVEQELIDQIASGPAGAAIAVCQIRDVYALGEEIGEAYARAKDALTQLKALPL
jgi:hypothetical protein